ncbi:hypothetical protein [Qipengyuania sp.]|uniref:hypothetical protein n=1 Tax=Qipengyuania sp. TaxID=2004515 RepID=UPI0035C7F7D2
MKAIATVNFNVPTVEDEFGYHSGASLLDFDIVIFSPSFPWFERQHFTNGGSCISIDSSRSLLQSMSHWRREILEAVKRGSTVFVILDQSQTEQFATGITSPRKNEINYQTEPNTNYSAIPRNLSLRNTSGRKINVKNVLFKPLFETLKDILQYKVILESDSVSQDFVARDGSTLGGTATFKDAKGHLVLLPYFDFNELVEEQENQEFWSAEALRLSNAFIKQLVEIDKCLKRDGERSPPPEWVAQFDLPEAADQIQEKMAEIDREISKLANARKLENEKYENYEGYRALLYATGNELEKIIEKALQLIGYDVSGLRIGDLEIDHILTSPEGYRMIGEAEGKDNSAIAISKFRQLESNINEDFDQEEVEVPAAGILFGNGYRLKKPSDRPQQFTDKCLTNAKRLQTSLVRTCDLYSVVVHIIDNPDDEIFKKQCRDAIECSRGEVVRFPNHDGPSGVPTPPPSATRR